MGLSLHSMCSDTFSGYNVKFEQHYFSRELGQCFVQSEHERHGLLHDNNKE